MDFRTIQVSQRDYQGPPLNIQMSDSNSNGNSACQSASKVAAGGPCAPELPSTAAAPCLRPSGEEPTFVSNRAPMLHSGISDSAWRIMEGRIMPGDYLGHFELLKYVGGGGMGRVYRALDTRLDRIVALKILPPEQAADAETVQRFQNEAQSAARLDHENIARVHYVGEDRGIQYIAFEFVEGENIRKLVERKGPLRLEEAVSYTLQAVDALAHSNARHIVHRDIKPSNILITQSGQVKLIDMGLARIRRSESMEADLTASGVTLGTFDYISPEQARDPRNTDIRSDIYSLGCTFYFMLTGQPPFPEGTVLQKLLQHHGDPPPDVRQLRGDLPEEVNRVLQKMMAKDPARRYLDTDELIADLTFLAGQMGLQPIGPGGKARLPASTMKGSFLHRHLPCLASIAALACTLIALHIFWRISSPGEKARSVLPRHFSANESTAGLTESKVNPPFAANVEKTAASATRDKHPLENPPQSTGEPLQASEEKSRSKPPQEVWRLYPLANPAVRTGPGRTNPAADPDRRNVLLVVGDLAGGENEFTSLAAACSAARNGDVIELRYNGRREEKPVRMANLRVTIRAGDGYRPIIVFRPTETDPVKYPHSMFDLGSGRLTLSNLTMEFVLPREAAADDWTFLGIHGGQTVRVEKCVLTIVNASERMTAFHRDAAFFRVGAAAPSSEVPLPGGSPGASPLAAVELSDSVARGEATFIRVEDLRPVHLAWDNGLLATSEWLLWAASGPQAPKPDETLRIDLRHVTIAARRGLARLPGSRAAPYQFTVQFNCADDIIMTSPGNPLIEQEVAGPLENARRQIDWNGDHNFYQDIDVFWTIRGLGSDTSSEVLSFDGWRMYWGPSRENQPFSGPIEWSDPSGAERPPHTQTPADYGLNEKVDDNPALGAAEDGRDAGMQAERLLDFMVK
jgi:serine/threonine protein kinase